MKWSENEETSHFQGVWWILFLGFDMSMELRLMSSHMVFSATQSWRLIAAWDIWDTKAFGY